MIRNSTIIALILLSALGVAQQPPQDPTPAQPIPWRPLPSPVGADAPDDPVAIHVKQAITVSGETIDDATILVRGGKIVSIGKIVDIPRGTKHVHYSDCIATPGFVVSQARTGYAARGPSQGAATKAKDGIDPATELYKIAAASGITTMAIVPSGQGISGSASVIRTRGKSIDEMIRIDDAYLYTTFEGGTNAKDGIRKAFDSAKEEMEKFEKAEKEAKEAPKPKETPASAPAPTPGAPGAATQPAATQPAPKAPPKLDPRAEPVIKVLKKEKKLFVQIGQIGGLGGFGGGTSAAADILHFHEATKKHDFERIYSASSAMFLVANHLADVKAGAILLTDMSFEPNTRNRVNAPDELRRAGIKVGLLPIAESRDAYKNWLFKVGELVKMGFPEKEALRAMTLVPAELLGLGDQIGSLAPGREADIVFFDGNIFDASTKIRAVMIAGEFVPEDEL
ncbi:MAG: amidohydrolase family protein [Planctomycetota bacterium]